MLDLLDFIGFQLEIQDIEIRSHVIGVGGPSQRQNADIKTEPEDNLADGSIVTFSDLSQFGSSQHFAIGSQQRKALIDNFMSGAELADATIPTSDCIATVLDEARLDSCFVAQRLELFE